MHSKIICKQQEYCTDCPARKNCNIRKDFYKKSFKQIVENACIDACMIGIRDGIPSYRVFSSATDSANKIYKKQNEELSLHPTYSVD